MGELCDAHKCRCQHKPFEKDYNEIDSPPKLSQKEYISRKIDSLGDSFTIHGLSRSVNGKNIESVFWSTTICIGIICSFMIIYGLVKKYTSYSVYSEIRFQITDKNYFPSITFCEKTLLLDAYFAYCGVPARKTSSSTYNSFCNKIDHYPYAKVTASENQYWATDIFNVTSCSTWSGTNCVSGKYLRPARHLNNSCITLNYDGSLYDMYSHIVVTFNFTKPSQLRGKPQLFVILHDSEIREIDLTGKVDLVQNKHYDIKLDKTYIKRLPAKYPTNCSSEKSGDIFPGKYSRYACIESRNYIQMYEDCGVTIDYVDEHIPKEIKEYYKRNKTIGEALLCMQSHLRKELNQSSHCPFPCEALDLNVISTVRDPLYENVVHSDDYKLDIHFQRVDTYKVMEEKPLYTWDQMACEIGGFIGLVMGMSIISVVEVVAYIVLRCIRNLM